MKPSLSCRIACTELCERPSSSPMWSKRSVPTVKDVDTLWAMIGFGEESGAAGVGAVKMNCSLHAEKSREIMKRSENGYHLGFII